MNTDANSQTRLQVVQEGQQRMEEIEAESIARAVEDAEKELWITKLKKMYAQIEKASQSS